MTYVETRHQIQLLEQQAELCLGAARKLTTRARNQKMTTHTARQKLLDQADVFNRRAGTFTLKATLLSNQMK